MKVRRSWPISTSAFRCVINLRRGWTLVDRRGDSFLHVPSRSTTSMTLCAIPPWHRLRSNCHSVWRCSFWLRLMFEAAFACYLRSAISHVFFISIDYVSLRVESKLNTAFRIQNSPSRWHRRTELTSSHLLWLPTTRRVYSFPIFNLGSKCLLLCPEAILSPASNTSPSVTQPTPPCAAQNVPSETGLTQPTTKYSKSHGSWSLISQ